MWPSTAGFLTKHVQDSGNSRAFPCGSRKLDHRAPAADLYTGSYHRACRKTADALRPDRLLILSARYGLLDLDDIIEPYDTPTAPPTPSQPKPSSTKPPHATSST